MSELEKQVGVVALRKVNVTRLDLSKGKLEEIADFIAEEIPLYLFVNKTFWATILCSPTNLEEFAIGHLLSEGILESIEEIREIVLKKPEHSCYVKLKTGINVENRVRLSKLHMRVIPSACGSGSPYQYTGKMPKVKSDLKVNAQVVSNCVKQLNFKAEGFRKTGGLHVAAIYKSNGILVALAEDVGRHNAVDKVIGMVALKRVAFNGCFLALSGRMSGDVVFKAAKVGLPIISSLASALSSGIVRAQEANLTLVGFVRGKRMNIYTSRERIVFNTD